MIRAVLAILACIAAGALVARWGLAVSHREPAAPVPAAMPAPADRPRPVAAVAPPPPAPVRDPGAEDPMRGLDSGPCFVASVVRPAAGPPAVEGLARSLEPFRRLEAGLAPAAPTIRAGLVDAPQCPAVDFVARFRGRSGAQPRIAVQADVLGGADDLVGSVDGYVDRYVALVLVDRHGHVSDLGAQLRPSVDAVSFYMPHAGSLAEGPALLVAVLTSGRAARLPPEREAASFFEGLAAGLAQGDTPVAAARFIRIAR